MKEVEDYASPFRSFNCNHCGWCCQRTPCALAVLYGSPLKGRCPFLRMTEQEESRCALIEQQEDPAKKMAISQLIMSDMGCTHRFGPHPVSLMKELLKRGLKVHSPEWKFARAETLKELENSYHQSGDPDSLRAAALEFAAFCDLQESTP